MVAALLPLALLLSFVLWPRGGAELAPPPDPAQRAEAAALHALRARLRTPDRAEFQGLRVWHAAAPDERTVCGRILATDLPGGAADFVARVILRGPVRPGAQPMVILEEGPGLPRGTAGAQGRYCRDAPPAGTAPPPAAPLVSARAEPESATGAGIATPASMGGGPGAPGKAVVRSAANLRSGPGGGAPVLSTLPRGQVLTVFERAPGGWLRVGDATPLGWVHGSLVAEGAP